MAARETSVVTFRGDDKIEVREATQDDYDGVLAISDGIYEGFDYLPNFYLAEVNKPHSNFYVLLINDKIVSTYTMYMVFYFNLYIFKKCKVHLIHLCLENYFYTFF